MFAFSLCTAITRSRSMAVFHFVMSYLPLWFALFLVGTIVVQGIKAGAFSRDRKALPLVSGLVFRTHWLRQGAGYTGSRPTYRIVSHTFKK